MNLGFNEIMVLASNIIKNEKRIIFIDYIR